MCTENLKDLFGEEEDEPAPAVVEVPGSPSENSAASDDEVDKKHIGTAPSRERLTMLQKLKAIQHFEKNRMTQKELREWMERFQDPFYNVFRVMGITGDRLCYFGT